MKKQIVLIAAAFAALFAVSCTKETPVENTPVQGGMREVTITASVDQATKTAYDATGKFSWTEGDQISILGDDKNFYTFTAKESGASVSFTGKIPSNVELEHAAFYPADPNHHVVPGVEGATDGTQYDSYYYNVPEYKDLSVVPSAGLPMGSYNADGYVFKHMTGAAQFTFTNVPDEFDAVEVSFAQALKFNGEFETYVSDGVWSYFGAANAEKGAPEASYTRKVKVENNTAVVYLPYPLEATLWSGLTITVKAKTTDGKDVTLLSELKTKQHINPMPRATIVPMATVTLPDYVPEADLSKVNWSAANVASVKNIEPEKSEDAILEELKVVADENYMYVWIKSTLKSPYGANFIDIRLSDGDADANDAAKNWDQWPGTLGVNNYIKEHKGTIDAESGEITSMTFNYNGGYENIEYKNEIVDGKINWYLVFPIDYLEPYISAESSVHVGFRLWTDWDNFAAIPARGYGQSMLEVTLP